MIRIIYTLLVVLIISNIITAQEIDIVSYLQQIEAGKADQVKEALIKLQANYPDDPSVKFLDAVLTIDGELSAKKYEAVYKYHQDSKYADAALYRVFSYNYSLGFYKKAESLLHKLKTEYPNSPYIKAADRDIPDEEEYYLTETDEEEIPNPDSGEFKYTVQAGAFLNIQNANDLKEQLEKAGYYSEVNPKEVGGSILNVVSAGRFNQESEAAPLLSYLKENFKLNGRIISLTN